MSRAPSERTLLLQARSHLRRTQRDLEICKRDRDDYRLRYERAIVQVKEWKDRFDLLLRREQLPQNYEGQK